MREEPPVPLEMSSRLPSPAPTVYRAEEYAPVEVPLSDLLDDAGRLQLNTDVEAKGYFTVQLVKGRVRLQVRGYVGLIPLNDRVVIDIEPRVPVANLSRLLRVSRHMPDFLLRERSYERDEEWNESLLDLYASTLVERIEAVASSGLLREYRQEEDDTSFPRGRILMGPTYTRLHSQGIRHKVTASWFERTADNQPNRCLRYALWFLADRLARLHQRDRARRDLLLRVGTLYELFSEVSLDHSLSFMRDPVVRGAKALPSLRHYYRPALDIAVAIVLEHAIRMEGEKRAVKLPSLILDMGKLFEDYLRSVLHARALDQAWDTEVLDGNTAGKKLLFDRPPSEDATPDIVLRDRDGGSYPLVIEVKNIPVADNSSRSAIEQAIAYAASYRTDRVVLAHPKGRGQSFSGLRLQGKIGDLSLYQYVYDLAAEPLEAEDRCFTDAVRSLLPQQ